MDVDLPREPPRRRSKHDLAFIRKQECLLCHKPPTDWHDLEFPQPHTLARNSGEFTVQLWGLITNVCIDMESAFRRPSTVASKAQPAAQNVTQLAQFSEPLSIVGLCFLPLNALLCSP
ncbi:hypothetical protein ABIA06_006297 [Bradyrhizobium yuanmingense]